MKKTTEKPLKVWLHPQATLSLLRFYLGEYDYTPYEERLLCALLQSALLLLTPGMIIDATAKTEEEKANIMASVREGITVTPVVVSIGTAAYLARFEQPKSGDSPISLILLDRLPED